MTGTRPTTEQDRPDAVTRKVSTRGSDALHLIDGIASRPTFALAMVSVGVVWVAGSVISGFPTRVETAFQTVVAAVTLAMVFVIQHTQAREQRATQRKLDEILHALPGADDTLIAFEHAPDHEIQAAFDTHSQRRQDALGRSSVGTEH